MKENIEFAIENCLSAINNRISVQDTLTDLIIALISDNNNNIDLGRLIPIKFCGNIFEVQYIESFTFYDDNTYKIVLSLDEAVNRFELDEIDEISFIEIANAVIDYAIEYLSDCSIQDKVSYY